MKIMILRKSLAVNFCIRMDMSELKQGIENDDIIGIIKLLETGLSPDYCGGLPLQLAARQGSVNVAETLVQWGANTHLTTSAGATPLQLAVYSNVHWNGSNWSFLLEKADAEELVEAAAVAIMSKNMNAYIQIMNIGNCNLFTPTKLTGHTLAYLMKTNELKNSVKEPSITLSVAGTQDPKNIISKQLSPSVARFFQETSNCMHQSHSPLLQGVRSPVQFRTQKKLSPMFTFLCFSPDTQQ